MNPLTGATWGDLSAAVSIPEIPILGGQVDPLCIPVTVGTCDYDLTAFEQLQASNLAFNSRASIFHYMIFAHDVGVYGGGTARVLAHISGLSPGHPSSSFVVSLGVYSGQVGTSLQQAGTFMHELGHNLGLDHGGYDDVGFKPNYLSVMNYLFQFNGLIINGLGGNIDYSRFNSIPDLNELALDDNVGLNGGAVLANFGTSYYCPGGKPSTDPALDKGRRFVLNANGTIDWACDDSIKTGVITNINADYDEHGDPILFPPCTAPRTGVT